MDQKRKLLSYISSELELPGFPAYGKTLIEILGHDRVLVENHVGIIAYADNLIRVRALDGIVEIHGFELSICCMSRFQLVIRGNIEKILLLKGERMH